MENKDHLLEQLYKIKSDLNQNEFRISSLESGKVASKEEIEMFINQEIDNANISFSNFLSNEDLRKINIEFNESLNQGIKCDALEYYMAGIMGLITGIIDILFVKTPNESLLTNKSDNMFEDIVIKIANKRKRTIFEAEMRNGEHIDEDYMPINNIKSAIGYLERCFFIPYDQTATENIRKKLFYRFEETVSNLSADNHHAKSLGHYPDIFGLIASICNQFTNTSTFLDNQKGRIIVVNGTKEEFELQGDDIPSKIYCGCLNWFFHCISDVSGSSGSKSRGQGLPLPFTEFFQLCNFGKLKNDKEQNQTFATVMTRVYEEGYDLRHGMSCALPVIINDTLIRLVFVLKKFFVDDLKLEEIIESKEFNATIQRMTTVSAGVMCLTDVIEASVTSWGNWVQFFSHLNIKGWNHLAFQCAKELYVISDLEMTNISRVVEENSIEWDRLLQKSNKL